MRSDADTLDAAVGLDDDDRHVGDGLDDVAVDVADRAAASDAAVRVRYPVIFIPPGSAGRHALDEEPLGEQEDQQDRGDREQGRQREGRQLDDDARGRRRIERRHVGEQVRKAHLDGDLGAADHEEREEGRT